MFFLLLHDFKNHEKEEEKGRHIHMDKKNKVKKNEELSLEIISYKKRVELKLGKRQHQHINNHRKRTIF